LEADGEQTPINASAATPPSLQNTWFIALIATLFGKIFGRETQPSKTIQAENSDDDGDGETGTGTGSDMPEFEYPDQERDPKNLKPGKIAPATLKGGARRRKAARK
jgi:hypothetical protein